ncbi:M20/M25/M40 family metallo-hydrolase [Acidipila sp. 4G-K13]|uniref:M20/M25/M40 family metallo-hydrolase n=2 Tax=Paracidobacterium acidisoli TaxID=2303751 RepID=A0A372IJG2_9BACT|nr:M20/M25/M40 family metallo-hydrolase [Paracidobacterium acidisoli]
MVPAAVLALASLLPVQSSAAQNHAQPDQPAKALARSILQQLIEINTTDSAGSVSATSKAMEQRLLDGGFAKEDIFLGGPTDRKQNLVVRYRGTGQKKPVLFLCHEDVVEARREDWTTDPFRLIEKDGYFYGRGTQDMKDNDAILVTAFLLLKKEGYRPDRDLILALTADEEGGSSNGVDWLLKTHRSLIGDPAFVINPDGGGVDLQNGRAISVDMDATEKLYADFQLRTTNPGGHSSLPVPDNAIYHLADALERLQHYTFPAELNAVTRAYFEKLSTIEHGQRAEDIRAILKPSPDALAIARLSAVSPEWNSILHTTCVATRLLAGHANNALPQTAQANVNCRILPGHSREETRQALIRIVADAAVSVRYVDDAGNVHDTAPESKGFPPPPLTPEVIAPLEKLAATMWPGAPVIPTMATGASDSVYTEALGMPSYGISGIALETNDVRAHGKDERLPVSSYYRGLQFYYEYVKMLSGGQ